MKRIQKCEFTTLSLKDELVIEVPRQCVIIETIPIKLGLITLYGSIREKRPSIDDMVVLIEGVTRINTRPEDLMGYKWIGLKTTNGVYEVTIGVGEE